MSDRKLKTRILPYEDKSGYRFEVTGKWHDGANGVVVSLSQFEATIQMDYQEWLAVKQSIEETFDICARKPA